MMIGGTTEAIRDVSISELRSGEARLSQIMGEEITPLLSQAAANFRTATSHWWQSALVVADEGSRALKRAIRTAPHVYNSPADIEKYCVALGEFVEAEAGGSGFG